MKEAEALTKWCPFARAGYGTSHASRNRTNTGQPAEGSMCLGSECMAYREIDMEWKITPEGNMVPVPGSGRSACALMHPQWGTCP